MPFSVVNELEAHQPVRIFLLHLKEVVEGMSGLGKHLLGAGNSEGIVNMDGSDGDAHGCVAGVDSMVRRDADEVVGGELLVHVLIPKVRALLNTIEAQ